MLNNNLYNEQQKLEFIKFYQGDSNNNFIRTIFEKIKYDEEFRGKDISEFTEKEILETLNSFNTSSINSLRVKTSILRTYASWCETNGYISNNINSFVGIGGSDLERCVNQYARKNKLISYEQLFNMCSDLPNPVDKFILMGIFNGIRGKNLNELGFLRRKDLHEDYFDLQTRKIKVPFSLYAVAMESVEAEIYVYMKGRYVERKLMDCDYVFKPRANVDDTAIGEGNGTRIQRRITNLKEVLDAPELTIASLYYSGMIHHMSIIAEEKGIDVIDVLDTDGYEQIKEQYNITLPKFTIRANVKAYLSD